MLVLLAKLFNLNDRHSKNKRKEKKVCYCQNSRNLLIRNCNGQPGTVGEIDTNEEFLTFECARENIHSTKDILLEITNLY